MSSEDSTTPAMPESDESGDSQGSSERPKHARKVRVKRWEVGLAVAVAAVVAFLANIGAAASYGTGIIHHFRTVCLANTPVNFDLPSTNSPPQVGEYVDAYGTHKWVNDEQLWLFVYAFNQSGSEEVYYPFPKLQVDGSSWVADRIKVGRNLSTDAGGSLYPLDLVLADSSADNAISKFMAQKDPAAGMSNLPKGAEVVKQVILSRVC
jgi:hypothetical protein